MVDRQDAASMGFLHRLQTQKRRGQVIEVVVGSEQRKLESRRGGRYPEVIFAHVAGAGAQRAICEFSLAEGINFGVAVDDCFDVDVNDDEGLV